VSGLFRKHFCAFRQYTPQVFGAWLLLFLAFTPQFGLAEKRDCEEAAVEVNATAVDNNPPNRVQDSGQLPIPARYANSDGFKLDLQAFPDSKIARPMGKGGMGAVYQGVWTEPDGITVPVIAKVAFPLPGHQDALRREYEFLKMREKVQRASGDNGLWQVRWVKGNPPMMVMRIFPASPKTPNKPALDLRKAIDQNDPTIMGFFADPVKYRMLEESLMEDLESIHNLGLVHADIKPANILVGVDEKGNPRGKIIDMGITRKEGYHSPGSLAGSPGWWNPDTILYKPYHRSRDVFALQRLLLATRLPKEFSDLEATGIARDPGHLPTTWHDPIKTFEESDIPKEEALVLASHLPQSIPELRDMLAEARNPQTFPARYMKRWKEAYGKADEQTRRLLLYDIIHAPVQREALFAQLNPKQQERVIASVKDVKERIENNTLGPIDHWFGFAHHSKPFIEDFLNAREKP
jgi:serine/threonine protein kinase